MREGQTDRQAGRGTRRSRNLAFHPLGIHRSVPGKPEAPLRPRRAGVTNHEHTKHHDRSINHHTTPRHQARQDKDKRIANERLNSRFCAARPRLRGRRARRAGWFDPVRRGGGARVLLLMLKASVAEPTYRIVSYRIISYFLSSLLADRLCEEREQRGGGAERTKAGGLGVLLLLSHARFLSSGGGIPLAFALYVVARSLSFPPLEKAPPGRPPDGISDD